MIKKNLWECKRFSAGRLQTNRKVGKENEQLSMTVCRKKLFNVSLFLVFQFVKKISTVTKTVR